MVLAPWKQTRVLYSHKIEIHPGEFAFSYWYWIMSAYSPVSPALICTRAVDAEDAEAVTTASDAEDAEVGVMSAILRGTASRRLLQPKAGLRPKFYETEKTIMIMMFAIVLEILLNRSECLLRQPPRTIDVIECVACLLLRRVPTSHLKKNVCRLKKKYTVSCPTSHLKKKYADSVANSTMVL